MAGGSAAQGAVIGCLDAILGLEHDSGRKDVKDDSVLYYLNVF